MKMVFPLTTPAAEQMMDDGCRAPFRTTADGAWYPDEPPSYNPWSGTFTVSCVWVPNRRKAARVSEDEVPQ